MFAKPTNVSLKTSLLHRHESANKVSPMNVTWCQGLGASLSWLIIGMPFDLFDSFVMVFLLLGWKVWKVKKLSAINENFSDAFHCKIVCKTFRLLKKNIRVIVPADVLRWSYLTELFTTSWEVQYGSVTDLASDQRYIS